MAAVGIEGLRYSYTIKQTYASIVGHWDTTKTRDRDIRDAAGMQQQQHT